MSIKKTVWINYFFDLIPENKQIEDILIKCSTLNDFYSTNIFSIFPVAKHILQLDIDKIYNELNLSSSKEFTDLAKTLNSLVDEKIFN